MKKHQRIIFRVLFTVVIGALAVSMITPFLWMLSASMKLPLDVMKLPIEWIPKYFYPDNYKKVWNVGGPGSKGLPFWPGILELLKDRFHQSDGIGAYQHPGRLCLCQNKVQGKEHPVFDLSGDHDDPQPGDPDPKVCYVQ